jgi:hypothetical protein
MQHELLVLKWRRIEMCFRYKLKTLSTNFVGRVTLNVEYIFVECRVVLNVRSQFLIM